MRFRLNRFQLTPQWSKDDYSDAIVNIFTRLNTAGRTLTREEITLAWLKVGWLPKETAGKTAGQCLEDLKSALADRGFQLETDEIVRLISFVWAVEIWGDAAVLNFQNFASDLNSLHAQLKNCSVSNFLLVVDNGIAELLARIATKAIQHIENIVVRDRRRVHAY
jgi:hypothetical protein